MNKRLNLEVVDMTSFPMTMLEPVLRLDRNAVCANVLEVCRSRMPEEPAQGWLPWIYDYLTGALYPDQEGTPPDPACAEAVQTVYLPALEWVLERETAPFDPMTDLLPLPEQALEKSRIAAEYGRFQELVQSTHLMP